MAVLSSVAVPNKSLTKTKTPLLPSSPPPLRTPSQQKQTLRPANRLIIAPGAHALSPSPPLLSPARASATTRPVHLPVSPLSCLRTPYIYYLAELSSDTAQQCRLCCAERMPPRRRFTTKPLLCDTPPQQRPVTTAAACPLVLLSVTHEIPFLLHIPPPITPLTQTRTFLR